jgi:hypothetical protein
MPVLLAVLREDTADPETLHAALETLYTVCTPRRKVRHCLCVYVCVKENGGMGGREKREGDQGHCVCARRTQEGQSLCLCVREVCIFLMSSSVYAACV